MYCIVFSVCQALGYRSIRSEAITKVQSDFFSMSGQIEGSVEDLPVLIWALQVSVACFVFVFVFLYEVTLALKTLWA